MKKNLTAALAIIFVFIAGIIGTSHAGSIDPRVEAEFQKRGLETPLSVIVRLKSQVVFKDIPASPSRVNYVKKSLQAHARISQKPLIDFIKSLGQSIKAESLWITNAMVITGNRNIVSMIASRPEVDMVYLNATVTIGKPLPAKRISPSKPDQICEWNIETMNVPAIWTKYNLRGENVKIGHLDTGCDASHPDCAGKIYAFHDFISEKNDVAYDDQGHGTHTIGTIMGGNASGRYIGVAPNATIAVAKVFDQNGSAKDETLLKAMQWIMDPDGDPATNDAPRLVSNSWGSDETVKTFWDAVESWRAANIFPLFAAGNSGPSAKTVGTPGGLLNAVAVGATDKNDKIASFSSRGPILWDGVATIKPDVSAPGQDIYSAVPGGKWGLKSGTSMATPAVAGVIALLYQANPDLSINDITQILEMTGKDLGAPGKDNDFGSCRIDAYQAVTRVLNSGVLSVKVTDDNGAPLIANVEINDKLNFETKNDGTFKTTLEAGNHKLKVSCFGYISETKGATIEKDSIKNIEIKLKTAPLTTITGTVSDKLTNAPLPANVSVLNTNIAQIQTDPKTGRFLLSIPAGDYKLKVASFKYKTEITNVTVTSDELKLAFKLESLPSVLVIADSSDAKIQKFYKDSLTDAQIKYTYFDTASSGNVTTDLLIQYPLVIWFTGADSSQTLTDSDQSSLTAYLNAGGALLLSGQDIGYELKSKKFYSEYLKARYESDASKIKNITATEAIAEMSGFNFKLDGPESANNQQYPDIITALSPAKILFNYNDGTSKQGAAILVATDVYKVIYLGFGIEGIATAQTRSEFIKRAVKYLIPGFSRNISSLAAAESNVASNKNADELASIAELECDKMV
ncbi:MAG TPA: S8 family serine peptidase, partial [Candidatus Wallbacteria bacterium]|nr:S8 family serine peptidase [Candidatus Wallbacteria bacterium]